MSSSIRDPPTMFEPYHEWKNEVLIWREFVDDKIKPEKQGMALFLSLAGDARKAASKVPLASMKENDGLEKVLAELDKFFLKDKERSGFLAYGKFNKFIRPAGMSVQDSLLKFDLLRNTCESLDFSVSDKVASHRMLDAANISPLKKDVIVTTLTNYSLDNMRAQILKVFSEDDTPLTYSASSAEADIVKCEAETSDIKSETVLYGSSGSGKQNYYRGKKSYRGGSYRGGRGRGYYKHHDDLPRKNCLDEDGNVTTCGFCGSVFHYEAKCPDKAKFRQGNRQSDPHL